ncbi:MAG: hypothetical protein IKI95_03815 [Clostridia bacterium]|nr:hypothetical protein [Clostridia bacterium]
MKCNKCNGQLSLFDKYCTNCGEKVTKFWDNIKIKPIKMPKIKLPRIKITKEISLIIIALIFAGAYITVENQKLDYKEKIRQEKIREAEENETLRNVCLDSASDDYDRWWNSSCKARGLKKDCSLPSHQADSYNKAYKNLKDECFKKYPVINP